MLEISREQFMKDFWNYYIMLENDFRKTIAYVELDEINFKTFSKEYIKLYQSICAEMDVIFKVVCGFNTDAYKNIINYSTELLGEFPDIVDVKIKVLYSDIELQPFKNWQKEESIAWWTAYNKVKHNRVDNAKDGNLKNILTSLSALYLLEKYLIKKSKYFPDSPDKESSLFAIKDWNTSSRMVGGGAVIITH